jgi:hypothetical protein
VDDVAVDKKVLAKGPFRVMTKSDEQIAGGGGRKRHE